MPGMQCEVGFQSPRFTLNRNTGSNTSGSLKNFMRMNGSCLADAVLILEAVACSARVQVLRGGANQRAQSYCRGFASSSS